MWGLPVDFPLSFLHTVSQQLAQRTLSTSSTCCGGRAALSVRQRLVRPHPHAHRAKAAVAGPAQRCLRRPRKGPVPRKTAQLQTFFLSSLTHEARRALHPICCMIPRPRAWDSIWLQLPTHNCFAQRDQSHKHPPDPSDGLPQHPSLSSCH